MAGKTKNNNTKSILKSKVRVRVQTICLHLSVSMDKSLNLFASSNVAKLAHSKHQCPTCR